MNLRLFPSRTPLEVLPGSTLEALYPLSGANLPGGALCAHVNNRVQGLDFVCREPADVEFLPYAHQSGARTYLRTLCFILFKSVHTLFPDRAFNLEHPIAKGYYCAFADRTPLSHTDVQRIKESMQRIIDLNLPFRRYTVPADEAVTLFNNAGMLDKALLIQTSGLVYATYFELDGYIDYFYGALAPSSGYVKLFDVIPFANGLLLRVPQADDHTTLCPVVEQPKMFDAYKRHLELQQAIGVNNVADLNQAIQNGKASQIVSVCEAMQEKHIARIAETIAERNAKLVLISGPSSSGKTTFCRRLQIQLVTNLLAPVGISLDDYYVNRDDTPRDVNGNYDFESLYAIDLDYFRNDLLRLVNGEEIQLPTYNFETGKREYRGNSIALRGNSVIVIEGIHGLNPELTDSIPDSRIFRIYVSALTTISIDGHNYIPTTDNRMLRRIVRDYRSRGYSAQQTIAMWNSVRRGEEQWIFPFQENADATFNSAMIYELAALRRFAEPVLNRTLEAQPEYAEAYRLLKFLRYFNYLPDREIPPASLLREFVG